MPKPLRLVALLGGAIITAPALAEDADLTALQQQVEQMQAQIDALEEAAQPEASQDGIHVGGAVRFTAKYEEYNATSKRTDGAVEMDTFRLNLDGTIGGVILSAEYRHYDYMDVIHHAWVGYDFSDTLQAQVGINQVPFGIQPYASHGFFFSGNYYLGLEDDYDFGIKLIHDDGPLNLQAAFYFNDEMGAANRSNSRYSYDIVGVKKPGGDFDSDPEDDNNAFGAHDNNVGNLRAAWTFGHDTAFSTEVGVSGQYGGVVDGEGSSVGKQYAYAAHLVGNYDRWNIQLQAAHYNYDMDNGWERMVVGAYAFYDEIPSKASTYLGNVAYSLPVQFGPVTDLTFYNDYSYVTDKTGGLSDTWMNSTGVTITAGGLFSYVEVVNAKNQPFIGGSMGNPDDKHKTRYNINVGYYF